MMIFDILDPLHYPSCFTGIMLKTLTCVYIFQLRGHLLNFYTVCWDKQDQMSIVLHSANQAVIFAFILLFYVYIIRRSVSSTRGWKSSLWCRFPVLRVIKGSISIISIMFVWLISYRFACRGIIVVINHIFHIISRYYVEVAIAIPWWNNRFCLNWSTCFLDLLSLCAVADIFGFSSYYSR